MPATDLPYLSVSEALPLMRSRRLSPVELMEATIRRAEAVEPTINAFTFRFFDAAMAAAREAEARYAGQGPAPRPLEGIPLAVKEETPVAGQPSTSASLIFRDHVANSTNPIVERMLAAGTIIHARTTCPEFSCMGFTHSRLFGVTRNPWNPDYDVGGSSGGAAAALAAGTATLATGSDIGGSIRIPASCCGVVGFKPPYGRVPQTAPFNLDHYCHEGPLARTVADCARFQNAISGPHPHDVASLRDRIELPTAYDGIEGWRIALSLDLDSFSLDDDVRRNTLAAADAFRAAGAIVDEVELGWSRDEIYEAAHTHYASVFGPYVATLLPDHRDEMTDYAIWFAEKHAHAEPGAYVRGLEIEGRIYARLGDLLTDYRLLICPTLALPALEAGRAYLDHPPAIDGVPLDTAWGHLMTIPFNICSRCPVLSVPSGFAHTGVPTGLQIVGRTYADTDVFRAAAVFEHARPWLDAPERRPML